VRNWIYSGSWTEAGPQLARRGTEDPSGLGVYANWAWSWPANRRVLYNRASCDVSASPGTRAAAGLVERRANRNGWATTCRTQSRLYPRPHGSLHHESGGCWSLFGPLAAFADGPFPETLRNQSRGPIANPLQLHSSQPILWLRRSNRKSINTHSGEGFNIVCTTYRLTEHYHYWTKNKSMKCAAGAGTVR